MQAWIKRQMEDKDREALKKVLKTQAGRWFFIRLLEQTGYQAPAFTGNSQTFYNEGRREFGVWLKKAVIAMLGMDGFDLVQKAEKEYVSFQQKKKIFYEAQEAEEADEAAFPAAGEEPACRAQIITED